MPGLCNLVRRGMENSESAVKAPRKMPGRTRWSWIVASIAVAQVACGVGGENVSYAIWNRSGNHAIEDARLFVPGERGEQVWIAASSRQEALPRGEVGWQSGGTAYLPDVGHRLPDRLYATWRSAGMSRGPYPIELRARIPADVLEKVRGNVRYQLEIGIGAGDGPPTVRWLLSEKVPARLGTQVVRRGGNW